MINSICWLVTKPMGVELSALGIRSAWATHQFSLETKLVFADEGVMCLTGSAGYHTSMLTELMAQEGEVFCLRESLEKYRIDEDRLLDGVQVLDADDMADLVEECETINTL